MNPSNFTFLQPDWPELLAEARRAEAAALSDPRTACFYARHTLELAVAWLFQAEGGRGGCLNMPYKADLSAFLFEPSFQQLVGPAVHAKMDVLRRLGNHAVHQARAVPVQDAQNALRELFHVAFWLARHYARKVSDRPDPALQFCPELLPQPADPNALAQAQNASRASRAAQAAAQEALQKQAEALAERDAALREAAARNAALDAELAQTRAEFAAAKAVNAAAAAPAQAHDYHEAATRDLFIDLLLKEAGWPLSDARDREFEVQGMPNAQGKGYVDYVLWGDDGKPLAIVEAKRSRRSAKEGEQQATLYADCLEAQFGQRPVLYGSNGYAHWLLHEAGGSDGDLARARDLHTSLPVFIRSLVGLDREAATQAFAGLVASGTASASQLQFIDEIVQHLTEHGAMPAARLYASPFTDIHAHGPDGVFDAANVEHLFKALEGLELQQAAA